jgi:hypothetical protein
MMPFRKAMKDHGGRRIGETETPLSSWPSPTNQHFYHDLHLHALFREEAFFLP